MTPTENRIAEVANEANAMTVQFALALSRKYGEGGVEYEAAVASAATTLSFHAFRLGLSRSKESGIEVLRALLGDVLENIKKTSGVELEAEVREPRKI